MRIKFLISRIFLLFFFLFFCFYRFVFQVSVDDFRMDVRKRKHKRPLTVDSEMLLSQTSWL